MNATEHEQTVEGVVRIFSALDTTDAVEAGGFGSERDAVYHDLLGLSREELLASLVDTERLLGVVHELASSAEQGSVPAMMVIRDAQNRVDAALELLRTT